MKCKKVINKLSAFLDNELNEKDKAEIKKHISICPACRKELASLSQSWDTLEAWEGIAVPHGFEEKFWQRVQEEEQKKFSWEKYFGRFFNIPVPIAASLILILGLFLGNYFGNILYSKNMISVLQKYSSPTKSKILFLNAFDVLPEESLENAYITLISEN